MTQLETVTIKWKEYTPVAERLRFFNENYPNWSIRTERTRDGKMEIFKATIIPDTSNLERYFSWTSQAVRWDGHINKTSALENCETSAIWRALWCMGIGILWWFVASADEIKKSNESDKKQYEKFESEITPLLNDMIKEW